MVLKENPSCATCPSRYTSVFCEIGINLLGDINRTKGYSVYRKGQLIFHEGSRPSGLFVVHTGKVKIFKIGEEGREQIIRFAKTGDIIGYRALLSDDLYMASATTMEESGICFIPRSLINELIAKEPSFPLQVMKLLSNDLRVAEDRLTDFAQKPVRERLAEALLTLRDKYGYEEDEKTLNINMTREEIANIIGTATETVIRILSDLKSEKVLMLNGRRISILNERKLSAIANMHFTHH
ncbi:MAG: Crp/Fnr family transcriptional regulator [Bacteroidia bacterium]